MDWINKFTEMLFSLNSEKVNIEGAYMLKHQHLPSSIFKYREANEYSIKNLEEDTVWLSDPNNFNDPYDCAHTTDYQVIAKHRSKEYFNDFITKKEIHLTEKEKKELESNDDPFSELINIIISREPIEKREAFRLMVLQIKDKLDQDLVISTSNQIAGSFRVCSFSERNDSMLMWAHYAKYHEGFCIEYDLENLPYMDYRRRFLYPVIYSDDMFDATNFFKLNIDDKNFNPLHLKLSSLIKAKDWSYEKEWRLVFDHDLMQGKQSYDMYKPKNVYLGSRIKEEDQNKIVAICIEKGIPYFKMKVNHRQFKVEPTSIQDTEQYFFKNKNVKE